MYSKKYIKEFKIKRVYINNYELTKYEQDACEKSCKKLKEDDVVKIDNLKFLILNPSYNMNDENNNSLK